ncbi:MAG: response regulator [Limisphaerales bacterium]
MRSILVIDDNEETRAFLKLVLNRHGYEVRTAAGGDEGLALFEDAPADVVIVDVLMPIKGGLETIVELRHDHPGVRLIAISGGFNKSTDQDPSLADALGVHRTCAKPCAPDDLLRAVREVLGETPVR